MSISRGTAQIIVIIVVFVLGGAYYWLHAHNLSSNDEFVAQSTSVVDLDWSADGSTLLSRSQRGSRASSRLLLHQLGENDSARLLVTAGGYNWSAALLRDASAALFTSESGELRRIDLNSYHDVRLLRVATPDDLHALSVSADGSVVAVAVGNDVLVCDAHSGAELVRLTGHVADVNDVAFSANGSQIATACSDGTIRIWDRQTARCVHVLSARGAPVWRVRFAGGDQQLAAATGPGHGALCLWDVAQGALLWERPADQTAVWALAVSPDGALAATGGFDRQIVIWRLRENLRLGSLSGHTGTVRALQFGPGGKLASAAEDGTIRFWNIQSLSAGAVIAVEKIKLTLP
ncbi:MAG: WD40 repeat domain-containing protein [Planctomycetaceae bacterium]